VPAQPSPQRKKTGARPVVPMAVNEDDAAASADQDGAAEEYAGDEEEEEQPEDASGQPGGAAGSTTEQQEDPQQFRSTCVLCSFAPREPRSVVRRLHDADPVGSCVRAGNS
jgi:hypothetical protein